MFVIVILLYIVAYSVPSIEFIANVVLASLFGLTFIDIFLIFSSKTPIEVERNVSERLNLGDENKVKIIIKNTSGQPVNFTLIEGYPIEMQERSAAFKGTILSEGVREFEYTFIPKSRGVFGFGDVFVLIRSLFFLATRRIDLPLSQEVHVYPSVLQMKR